MLLHYEEAAGVRWLFKLVANKKTFKVITVKEIRTEYSIEARDEAHASRKARRGRSS